MASERSPRDLEGTYWADHSPCSTDDDNDDEEYIVRVPGVGSFTSKPRNAYKNINNLPKDLRLPVIENNNEGMGLNQDRRRGERSDPDIYGQETRQTDQGRNPYGSSSTQDVLGQQNEYSRGYVPIKHDHTSLELETMANRLSKHSGTKSSPEWNHSGTKSSPEWNHSDLVSLHQKIKETKRNSDRCEKAINRIHAWEERDDKSENEQAYKKRTRKVGRQQQPCQTETTWLGPNKGENRADVKHVSKYSVSNPSEKDLSLSTKIFKKISVATSKKGDERNYVQASTWREMVSERRNSNGGKKPEIQKGKVNKSVNEKQSVGGQSLAGVTGCSFRKSKESSPKNAFKHKATADSHYAKSNTPSPGSKNGTRKITMTSSDKLDAYERTMMELNVVGDGRLDDVDINVYGYRPPNEANYAKTKYGELTDYDAPEDLNLNSSDNKIVNERKPSKPSPRYARTKADKSHQMKKYADNRRMH